MFQSVSKCFTLKTMFRNTFVCITSKKNGFVSVFRNKHLIKLLYNIFLLLFTSFRYIETFSFILNKATKQQPNKTHQELRNILTNNCFYTCV